MDIYAQIAEKIIKEQETIIGPVALEQARKVPGLTIDGDVNAINFNGDKKEIIENLVKKYEELFGRTSIEVCKEAIRSIITPASRDQLPQLLLN